MLCNLTDNALDTTSGVLKRTFSDHQLYVILLNNILTTDSPPVYVKVIKQDNESKHNFYNEILKSDKLINLQKDFREDPTNTYQVLRNVIQDAKINTYLLN